MIFWSSDSSDVDSTTNQLFHYDENEARVPVLHPCMDMIIIIIMICVFCHLLYSESFARRAA